MPTVALSSVGFVEQAHRIAEAEGLAELRIVSLPASYTPSNSILTAEQLEVFAESILDSVVEAITVK
ncbi:hypothetical protein ACFLUK_01195 [Chloroflexota bacterium]